MHPSEPPRKASSPATAASPPRPAFAAMVAGNLLLAFGPWLVRLADVGPVAAGFWRLALALPLLLLLTRIVRQPIPQMAAGLWAILVLGGLFFALDLATWHLGIVRTRLANATLFGNVTSFIFPIYGFLIARRLPARNQAAALLLAAVGVGLLLGRSYELSARHFGGDLLCLFAGLCYTVYLIAIERARGTLQPLPALAAATMAGVLPLLALAIVAGERIVPQVWWPLAMLAIGSQVVGQGLMVYAIGHLSPVVIGLGFLVQPVVAATIGRLAYAERLTAADLAGAIAIGIALVLVRRPERRALERGTA